MILSILIPSIYERHHLYDKLMDKLTFQIATLKAIHPTLGRVEIVPHITQTWKQGGPSIGQKRHECIERAQGKYVCFLDDDDDISPDYVETLVRLCHQDKDVVTFRNFSTFDNYWMMVDMDLHHRRNEQPTPDHVVKRKPWHICPVRREYALQFEFPQINYGEDWVWFSQVLSLCKSQAKTNRVIHHYNHSLTHSRAEN